MGGATNPFAGIPAASGASPVASSVPSAPMGGGPSAPSASPFAGIPAAGGGGASPALPAAPAASGAATGTGLAPWEASSLGMVQPAAASAPATQDVMKARNGIQWGLGELGAIGTRLAGIPEGAIQGLQTAGATQANPFHAAWDILSGAARAFSPNYTNVPSVAQTSMQGATGSAAVPTNAAAQQWAASQGAGERFSEAAQTLINPANFIGPGELLGAARVAAEAPGAITTAARFAPQIGEAAKAALAASPETQTALDEALRTGSNLAEPVRGVVVPAQGAQNARLAQAVATLRQAAQHATDYRNALDEADLHFGNANDALNQDAEGILQGRQQALAEQHSAEQKALMDNLVSGHSAMIRQGMKPGPEGSLFSRIRTATGGAMLQPGPWLKNYRGTVPINYFNRAGHEVGKVAEILGYQGNNADEQLVKDIAAETARNKTPAAQITAQAVKAASNSPEWSDLLARQAAEREALPQRVSSEIAGQAAPHLAAAHGAQSKAQAAADALRNLLGEGNAAQVLRSTGPLASVIGGTTGTDLRALHAAAETEKANAARQALELGGQGYEVAPGAEQATGLHVVENPEYEQGARLAGEVNPLREALQGKVGSTAEIPTAMRQGGIFAFGRRVLPYETVQPLLQTAGDLKALAQTTVGNRVAGITKYFDRGMGIPGLHQTLSKAEGFQLAGRRAIMADAARLHAQAKSLGLTQQDLEQITRHLDEPLTHPLTPAQEQMRQTLADWLHNGPTTMRGEMGTAADLREGTLTPEQIVADYVPRRYQEIPAGPGVPGRALNHLLGIERKGAFSKQRLFETLAQAEAAGFKPYLDPITAIGTRLQESARNISTKRLAQEITKLGPDFIRPAEAGSEVPQGMKEVVIPGQGRFYAHPDLAAVMQDYLHPAGRGAVQNANQVIKRTGLLNPLVHGHNLAYNAYVNAGLNPADTPKYLRMVEQVSPEFVRASKAGAMSRGFREGGIPEDLEAVAGRGRPFERVRAVNDAILGNMDDALRLQLFDREIAKGATDGQAAAEVNRQMVDYRNLSPIENRVGKGLLPFYAWTKGNMAAQARALIRNPARATAVHRAIWALSPQSAAAGEDGKIDTGLTLPNGERLYADLYYPAEDLQKLGSEGPVAFAGYRAFPLFTEAVAQLLNKKAPFSPNDRISGEPIASRALPEGAQLKLRAAHALQNLGFAPGQYLGGVKGAVQALTGAGGVTPEQRKALAAQAAIMTAGGFTAGQNPKIAAASKAADQRYAKTQLRNYQKYGT